MGSCRPIKAELSQTSGLATSFLQGRCRKAMLGASVGGTVGDALHDQPRLTRLSLRWLNCPKCRCFSSAVWISDSASHGSSLSDDWWPSPVLSRMIHASFLQAIDGVKSLALCPQRVTSCLKLLNTASYLPGLAWTSMGVSLVVPQYDSHCLVLHSVQFEKITLSVPLAGVWPPTESVDLQWHGTPSTLWYSRTRWSCSMPCSVLFCSVQDNIHGLGKAHMRSTPSLRSVPKVAFDTVPVFVWLTMALSRPFKEDRLALPLPTRAFLQMVWCPWLCTRTVFQCPAFAAVAWTFKSNDCQAFRGSWHFSAVVHVLSVKW